MIALTGEFDRSVGGGKAAALREMKGLGLPVPNGFVVTRRVWDDTIRPVQGELLAVLRGDLPLTEKSRVLQAKIKALTLPPQAVAQLESFLKPGARYAVRSSALQEDLSERSFAGQYETCLNVGGISAVCQALLTCFASVFSVEVLSYLQGGAPDLSSLAMAVLVQEMAGGEKSGVAFTLNPLTGCDHELVIEIAPGLGEALVQGRVQAERIRCDWCSGAVLEQGKPSLLTEGELEQLKACVMRALLHYGYPVDVEFTFADGNFHLLQVRPVTRVMYGGLTDLWTTADFKDGGVSAAVCTPFMWSLYEYAWETAFPGFLSRGRLIPPKRLRKASGMFYGRPYWNLSMAKEAMSCIPGYREREFDREYGIQGNYTGDGAVTRYTPANLVRMARIAAACGGFIKGRVSRLDALHAQLHGLAAQYEKDLPQLSSRAQLEAACHTLIWDAYRQSECTYFEQIFINTVEQALFKDTILKHTDHAGYFALIGGLDNVSHLLPFYDMWELTRKIRADRAALHWWLEMPAEEIAASMGHADHLMPEFSAYLARYGYHSEKELDVTYPSFCETPETVVDMVRQTLALDDDCGPEKDRAAQTALFKAQLAALERAMPARRYKKLLGKILRLRRLLWWREEFRDVSTRFYHIIRQYMRKLAHVYQEQGVLEGWEDIWFLKITDLSRFTQGDSTPEQLRATVACRRRYYQAYRNYQSENEIGSGFAPQPSPSGGASALKGIGCTVGAVRGRARVIAGFDEIDRIEPGDILVTRFTDTGWTSKFALLRGIVTEYGGMLCHAAIVSREYGIPCVVCVKNALTRIPDGAELSIDGTTGEITLLSAGVEEGG